MGGPGLVLTGLWRNLSSGLVLPPAAMSFRQAGKRRKYRQLSLSTVSLECYALHHPQVLINLISTVQHFILVVESALSEAANSAIVIHSQDGLVTVRLCKEPDRG